MLLKICVLQLNYCVGDLAGNAQKIIDAASSAYASGARLVVTPELAICGYAAEDLFLRASFIQACDDAIHQVAHALAGLKGLTLVVGAPVMAGDGLRTKSVAVQQLHNAARVLREGQVISTYAKRELPNYQVFDERRYFTPGHSACVFDAEGDSLGNNASVKVGLLICEDAWFKTPAQDAKDAGAELLVVINASPYHMGKGAERERMMQQRARAVGLPLVYAHLVGGQDEIVFEGRSFALLPDGTVVGRAPSFKEDLFEISVETAKNALKKLSNQPPGQQIHARAAPDLGVNSTPEISAIGITNQRETTVLWDRATGQPLHNAIVWQDRRTAGRCDELRTRGHAELIQQKTGLVLDAYFSATKLAWLLGNIPGARARASKGELAFGTMDSWLVWNLTGGTQGGVHVTDASNASRTLLFNIHTMQWDEELLALFNIPPCVLPTVVASSGVAGHTDAALFGTPIPIAGIAGDQQAATFGQACLKSGMAKNTYGTGCFMLMNTGSKPVASKNKLLSTVGWQLDKTTYCLEGSVFMGGATIQWLRDGLNIIDSAADVQSLAESVPDSSDVYLVPAFTGLGTPHWDPYARGAMLGLTRGTTSAHIARAALEAIALQSADVFAAMSQDAGLGLKELRVDGGASANDLLMQMQADFSGVPVVRPKVLETTALGAAYLAGLAVGFWSGLDEIASQWQVDRRFEPHIREDERQAKLARWHKALVRAKAWVED